MKKLLEKYIIYVLALILGILLLPGAEAEAYYYIGIFALILFFINLFLLPIMLLLSLPFNIITFGLFSLVTNSLTILLTDKMMSSVDIGGFWNGVLVALFITVIREGWYVLKDKK